MKIIRIRDNCFLLQKQYASGSFLIDGQVISSIAEVLPLQFNAFPTIKRIDSFTETSHFVNEVGEEKSVEEYTRIIKKLDKSIDGVFRNLDDEYEYKKFTREWKPIYQKVTKYIDVPLEVLYQTVQSEFEDIEPIYTISDNVESELFIWKPDFRKYIEEIAARYGFEKLDDGVAYGQTIGRKYAFGRGAGLSYMVCNGSYSSKLYENSSIKNPQKTNTYDKLVIQREMTLKYIDNFFREQRQLTNNLKIASVGSVTKSLQEIIKIVQSIDPKVKTYSQKRLALGKLETLIADINK